MVADTFYPDGILVDVFASVPHRAPSVERFAVAIDDAIHRPFLGYAEVALAAFADLVEGAPCGSLRRVQDYKFC